MPHLYAYGYGDLGSHVRDLSGFEISTCIVHRNAAGTALYLYSCHNTTAEYKAIVISSRKQVRVLDQPADWAALDESLRFVAWYNQSGVSFRNGYRETRRMFGGPEFDPGGFYYSLVIEQQLPNFQTSRIASTDRPDVPLATVNIEVMKMFVKGGRLYVFGRTPLTAHEKVVCLVFRIDHGELIFEEEIDISRPAPAPSPFFVLDMDPWSPNVLLTDAHDMPFPDKWLLFNLDTRKATKLGWAKGYFGFFMQYDVLEDQPAVK